MGSDDGRRKLLPDPLISAERKTDGRNVDPRLGLLSGEASHQRVGEPSAPVPYPGAGTGSPTYYGLPVVKETVWVWSIPLYFQVGGLAGAASLLGAVADLTGRGRFDGLVRRCHWLGAAGDAVGGALLIHDLGRPERFLNMLRVFRPSSPMSMGSWILAVSGAANGAAVLLGHRAGIPGRIGKVSGILGGALGPALAGYGGVLLANTANPLWQRAHLPLPLLFMSAAVASAGAVLAPLSRTPRERRVARTFGTIGAAATLASAVAVERAVAASPVVQRPLQRGAAGALWNTFKACTAAGLALSLLPSRYRWAPTTSSVLTTAGTLAMRFAIFQAGKVSSRDPRATFEPQREGLGAAEVTAPSKLLRAEQPDRFPLPVLGQRAR